MKTVSHHRWEMLWFTRQNNILSSSLHIGGTFLAFILLPPEWRICILLRSIAYFLLEICLITHIHPTRRKQLLYFFHHLVTIAFLGIAIGLPFHLQEDVMHIFLILEYTTIWLNTYLYTKRTSTGVLFILSFFICRFCLFPWKMWCMYIHAPAYIQRYILPSMCPFMLMNAYWGWEIIQKLRRSRVK